MRLGKGFAVLTCACLVLGLVTAASAVSITIGGNSSHGTGDGSGSWNVTSILGSTTLLPYNSDPFSNPNVFSLGNGIYEQLACSNSVGPCGLGSGSSTSSGCGSGQTDCSIDVLFLIPASQIHGGTVTFNNFTFGSLNVGSGSGTVQMLSCDINTVAPGNGPGFLCSGGGLGSTASVSLVGTTLTFSGLPSGVSSFTFLLPYSNTSSTYSGPTLAGSASVPEPSSVILVGSGLLAGLFRRLKRPA